MIVIRRALLLGALVTACGGAAAQSIEDRLRDLERRVEELEKRAPVRPSSKTQLAPPSAPHDKAAWRSLKRGMSQQQIRSLFGEPRTVDANAALTFWEYANGATVHFDTNGRLAGWREPP